MDLTANKQTLLVEVDGPAIVVAEPGARVGATEDDGIVEISVRDAESGEVRTTAAHARPDDWEPASDPVFVAEGVAPTKPPPRTVFVLGRRVEVGNLAGYDEPTRVWPVEEAREGWQRTAGEEVEMSPKTPVQILDRIGSDGAVVLYDGSTYEVSLNVAQWVL